MASVVKPTIAVRSARMFGSHLQGAALENAGIGPHLSLDADSRLQVVRPTRTVSDRLEVTVAGVELHLVHAPGETDDQLFVWLDPLSPDLHAKHMAELAGGAPQLARRARAALDAGNAQWALELTDTLRRLQPDDASTRELRAAALRKLGEAQENPNARHYYLTAALEEEGLVAGVRAQPTPTMVHEMPMAAIFQGLATRLDAQRTLDVEEKVNFHFPDTGEDYSVHLRRGGADVQPRALPDAAATLPVDSRIWKEVAAKLRDPSGLLTDGGASVEGSTVTFLRFMSYFLGEPV